jgi:quercetin dioxygenase-like cupin family protein
MEAKTEIIENMCGGKGHVIIKHILGDHELNGKAGLYAQVTIEPGCTLGFHEHHAESETYYILSGTGLYNDNGVSRTVNAGDITYTGSGFGHGLDNIGDTDLVFMALIIFS